MRRTLVGFALLLTFCAIASAQKGATKSTPTPAPVLLPTKEIIDEYMHHMIGYDPNSKWQIVSISESEVPGMALVVMRVGEGEGRLTQLYVSADGRHAILGEAVPFGPDPFKETRELLAQRAKGPSLGSAEAPVTIVEFSDLQCPHCKAAQPIIDRLLADVPNSRLVFEEFPLEALHPWAFKAAAYAECVAVRKPRAFWTFTRMVYDGQLDITAENATDRLKEFATSAGVNADEAATCSESEATKDKIRNSLELGKQVGVTGTPMLFINGRKVSAVTQIPYETLKRLVEFEASEAQKSAATKTR